MIKKHGYKKMDGEYQMTKFKSVKELFIRDYIEVINFKSKSIDLDYFFKRNSDPLCFVKKGVEMLNELINLCEKEGILDNIMPCLIFPLKDSEDNKLITFDPKIFVLEEELHERSPGDICLVQRDDAKYYTVVEKYKCHMNIQWPIALHNNCRAFYGSFRNEEDLRHDWEFCRYICIEHYADNLLKR